MSNFWDSSRVLITGGAGLIGSTICDLLVKKGVKEIVVVDNFSRGTVANLEWATQNGNVQVREIDICDRGAVSKSMEGIDYVFHQAAIRITQCAKEPQLCVSTLVNGTQSVLDACVDHRVKKVVMASSASIYGMATQFPTSESHPPYANRTLYGACKTFGEGILRSYNDMYGLSYTGLRYFNVYGPRMDIHGVYTEVLIRWLDCIESNQAPVIHGDGSQTMDFVFSGDVAEANLLAMQSSVSDDVFNVGCGVETSLLELWETLARVCGSTLKPTFTADRKVNNVRRRLAQTSAADEKLGFRSKVSLEEGLRRLVQWRNTMKKQGRKAA